MVPLLIALCLTCVSCTGKTSSICPPFPVPSEHVATVLDDMAEQDKEVDEWLQKIRVLYLQLEACQK